MSDGNGTPTPETLELIKRELQGLKVDQGKVKFREWSDLEDAAGHECNPWIDHPEPPFWFMQGVLWLWLRRKHPQLRFADFGELDLETMAAARPQEPDLDPTSAPPERSGDEPTPTPSPPSATSGG